MMSQLKKYFLGFVLIACHASIQAYTLPPPGEFGISAEWLYMLNSIDDPYFVINSTPGTGAPQGNRVSNEQDWHSGYRVEGIYSFCSGVNDVRLRWTQFPSFCESKSVTGESLYGVLNAPESGFTDQSGTVAINDDFHFYALDLLFSQKVFDCCPFTLYLQAGVQYARLRFKEEILLTLPSSFVDISRYQSRLWGIGPEVGAEFNYLLSRCFSITGRGYGSLLISKRDARFFDNRDAVNPNQFLIAENEGYWRLIPATDIRFGLNYFRPLDLSCFRCLGCVNLDVEVGYEVMAYFNGVERIYFVDDANSGSSFNEMMTFTLHGPYVHAGITF